MDSHAQRNKPLPATHQNTDASIDATALKKEAERLYKEEIISRWKQSDNVWRNAWAMDTLLDYFSVCGMDDPSFGDAALNALNPMNKGNWWDDFGWIGIASLRAAEQRVATKHTNAFLKIAINAWAYMYGPGWSKTNKAVYPFTDDSLPGWKEFSENHKCNTGAPNVWHDIENTWPESSTAQRQEIGPRYTPGGAWNSAITNGSHPSPTPDYYGSMSYLNPVQNTVTNGLYTILSLRIYLASRNKEFEGVFSVSDLDTDACLQAWKEQIEWFGKWMLETANDEESLQFRLEKGSLIRERVSTFQEYQGKRLWDAAYDKQMTWTGDQGLLLGALREGLAAGLITQEPKVLHHYPELIEGVFENGYQPRRYGSAEGDFLLPWIVIDAANPYTAASPGNDDGDYQTGTGVFMRYLLQAYQANPALLTESYRKRILDSAGCIARGDFGIPVQPKGRCDALTPIGTPYQPDNQMTAYVNRLSILILAIAINNKKEKP